jgi:hypothetical protein
MTSFVNQLVIGRFETGRSAIGMTSECRLVAHAQRVTAIHVSTRSPIADAADAAADAAASGTMVLRYQRRCCDVTSSKVAER